MEAGEIAELNWLYRPYLLLFKREFSAEVVSRLWDSFFAAAKPYSFPRFFLAAILVILFPKLMLRTNGSIEDVTSLSDQIIADVNGLAALNVAIGLEDQLSQDGASRIFDNLPDNAAWRDYDPAFFELK
jgi:hypothetical protein